MIGDIDITSYEPDAPNFTPRISGCVDYRDGALHMVRKKGAEKEWDRFVFNLEPGKAIGVSTYLGGNENPLLPYNKMSPLEFKVVSTDVDKLADSLFDAIDHPNPDDNNKSYAVSSAVMIMTEKEGLKFSVRNRF